MTPEQIAASLTPAQVRGLKLRADLRFLGRLHPSVYGALSKAGLVANERLTPLGLAVLAALDKGAAT